MILTDRVHKEQRRGHEEPSVRDGGERKSEGRASAGSMLCFLHQPARVHHQL
jgi:hypothetical protein